jgi:hypothetical protein
VRWWFHILVREKLRVFYIFVNTYCCGFTLLPSRQRKRYFNANLWQYSTCIHFNCYMYTCILRYPSFSSVFSQPVSLILTMRTYGFTIDNAICIHLCSDRLGTSYCLIYNSIYLLLTSIINKRRHSGKQWQYVWCCIISFYNLK